MKVVPLTCRHELWALLRSHCLCYRMWKVTGHTGDWGTGSKSGKMGKSGTKWKHVQKEPETHPVTCWVTDGTSRWGQMRWWLLRQKMTAVMMMMTVKGRRGGMTKKWGSPTHSAALWLCEPLQSLSSNGAQLKEQQHLDAPEQLTASVVSKLIVRLININGVHQPAHVVIRYKQTAFRPPLCLRTQDWSAGQRNQADECVSNICRTCWLSRKH